MFHIYTDRVGLHEFLQIVNYDFSYQVHCKTRHYDLPYYEPYISIERLEIARNQRAYKPA
jgi:hypothetical protein